MKKIKEIQDNAGNTIFRTYRTAASESMALEREKHVDRIEVDHMFCGKGLYNDLTMRVYQIYKSDKLIATLESGAGYRIIYS